MWAYFMFASLQIDSSCNIDGFREIFELVIEKAIQQK